MCSKKQSFTKVLWNSIHKLKIPHSQKFYEIQYITSKAVIDGRFKKFTVKPFKYIYIPINYKLKSSLSLALNTYNSKSHKFYKIQWIN